MGMDLSHGGHLTHGSPSTYASRVYNFVSYQTRPDGSIDYDLIAQTAKEVRPTVLLA
jgi:glycine hydroxymethyltransferase